MAVHPAPRPSSAAAPSVVQEVLRTSGQPLDAEVRRSIEERIGQDLADVRIHTDERAGASAQAVGAHAYTVGRQIVFAPGHFDTGSEQGRQLLEHELVHAAGHPAGAPTPSGLLRISTPGEPAEQLAAAVAQGPASAHVVAASRPVLFRQPGGLVRLRNVRVNHDRVTVPAPSGLSFSASKVPGNASTTTLSVEGDNATIAAATTVDNTTGAITVAPGQTGGSAHVKAEQTEPSGATSFVTAPFNFTAIATGISSTSSSQSAPAGSYGGEFTHTFKSPSGGQTALERSHVNEQFAGARGTTLTLTGSFGPLTVQVNPPNDAAAGWDLDDSGAMTGPDHVTWDNTADARPLFKNASTPSPNPSKELTAIQNFRNLTFPNRTYGAAAVASTTHRRAFEDRNNLIKAITSAGINAEIVDDYAGPTIFRRCTASPASIPVAAPSPPGAGPAPATTSTITVDAEGKAANPKFTIRPPNLGCTITSGGELTPGTTPGTVTIRAGDSANFDETTVTLTPQPAKPTPNTNPTPKP